MSSATPHKGLLRDETLTLRYIFGYGLDKIHSSTLFTGSHFGKTVSSSSIRDILFVAVDVDTIWESREVFSDQYTSIGVSILDTRDIYQLSHLSQSIDGDDAISPYQLFTEPRDRNRRNKDNRYLFANSESIDTQSLKTWFNTIVQDRD